MLARLLAALVAVSLTPSVVVMSDVASAAAEMELPCAGEAATDAVAEAMALRCETRVEVVEDRTELAQVFVEPSGARTLEAAVTPQRVRKRDGIWSPVSTTLIRHEDGSVVPRAVTADVAFSGGGAGPFATWRSGATTFTLSWPKPLPSPRLADDTAVYDEVLPGVALHVTALSDGFRHALEVKSAEAAKNPALQEITYVVGGNAQRRPTGSGIELVDTSGNAFATTGGASMWDSANQAAIQGPATRAKVGQAPSAAASPDVELTSNAQRPGEAANVRAVEVTFADTQLTVTPDASMLANPSTVFPIFIDPPFNGQRNNWSWANSSDKNWDVLGRAWVGRNPYDGVLYRSFFDFNTTKLAGSTILKARVDMKLDHSWTCGDSWVWLHRTSAISAGSGKRMNWGTRPLPGHTLDSWAGHANQAGGCSKVQPNAQAVFENPALLNDIQGAANGGWPSYTVGLCACNDKGKFEADQDRWKKFFPDSVYLIATYDKKPNRPSAEAFSATTDCYKACSSPAVLRNVWPTLKAQVSDPFGGTLRTEFDVRTGASDAAQRVAGNGGSLVHTHSGGSAQWLINVALSDGVTYYWRARSTDENNMVGDWSDWQILRVDTTPPATPVVVSDQYPRKAWGSTVGTPGNFFFNGSPDAFDFTWLVDSGNAMVTTNPGVQYAPPKDMVRSMRLYATDVAGNRTPNVDYQFWVTPLPNRCWNWRLNENAGSTAADHGNTDADDAVCRPLSGTTVQAQPATVGGTVSFSAGYVGNAATFTGNGEIATSGPVLDTTKSFTVMAWVRSTDLKAATEQTVLSQDGQQTSRFALMYRKDANDGAGGWCFVLRDTDQGGTGPTMACATGQVGSSHLPTTDEWVHLGGVYDAVTGSVQVHVMGNQDSCDGEMAKSNAPAGWPAGGSFVIGRGKTAGAVANHWRGQIDQVYAHQRVLTAAEICKQAIQ